MKLVYKNRNVGQRMQIVELAIQHPCGFAGVPLLSKYKKARTCPRATPRLFSILGA